MKTFYSEIKPIYTITEITDPASYVSVPEDWYVAAIDVRGSTIAIAEGRYKDVNAVAAASITALLNVVKDIDLPFVFGGDGATVLVPPSVLEPVRRALRGTQKMAQEHFSLDLRAGLVPVIDVLKDGYQINVARLWYSDKFQQAIFSGGGVGRAESLLKTTDRYDVPINTPADANFEGFECRWNTVPSPSDETISLIVDAKDAAVYRKVLDEIDRIYGGSEARRPIAVDDMSLMINPDQLTVEARIRHQSTDRKVLRKIARSSLFGKLLMAFNINNWGSYKQNFVLTTDHEKFDDVLRMTISGTTSQREELETHLRRRQDSGDLLYGIHVADGALVTCIVFDYFGRQVHFVDTVDGGYALAAKAIKEASKLT